MAVKDILLIRSYVAKDGTEKAEWCKAGVCFGTNKDGSMNFEIYSQPGVKYQIREREERKRDTSGAEESQGDRDRF